MNNKIKDLTREFFINLGTRCVSNCCFIAAYEVESPKELLEEE